MSYFFTMAFAEIRDKAAAYDLCQKAVNSLAEKNTAREHIRNCFPAFKMRCDLEGVDPTALMRDMWLQDIFQIRFVYWPQYRLLALCGDNYPAAVSSLFGPSIEFQNSTDQDYDLSDWDSDVSLFQSTIVSIANLDSNELRNRLDFDVNDSIDEGYVRRSAIYKSIFASLDLDRWLYGYEGQFERIRMSGLTSQEKIMEVQTLALIISERLRNT